MEVKATVAVGVFVDCDLVAALDSVRRRQGNLVVDGSQVLVAADHLQAGRVGVLLVVEHPQSAAFVPVDEQWLADKWFGEDLFEAQVVGNLKAGDRLVRRQRVGVALAAAEIEFDVLDGIDLGEVCRRVLVGTSGDVAVGPGPVVAGTVVPLPLGANGLVAGQQDGCGDQEVAACILHIGSHGDDVGLAEPDRIGRDQEA